MSGERCPNCGETGDRGRLVCLGCGGRLELGAHRSGRRLRHGVLAAGAVLLCAAGAGAYAVLSGSDDGHDRAAAHTRPERDSSGDPAAPPRRRQPPAKPAPPPSAGEPRTIVKDGGTWRWPRDLTGWTVVLFSSDDRDSAERFARSGRPADRLGVVDSDEFPTLPENLYVVFAGRYPDQAAAQAGRESMTDRYTSGYVAELRR